MDDVNLELAPLPPALEDLAPPREVAAAPDPPETDAEDARETPKPTGGRKKVEMNQSEVAEFAGHVYGDIMDAVAHHVLKVKATFPEARAAKRGRELAFALQKLGFKDYEILLAVGLVAGLASDIAWLKSLKDEADANAPTRPAGSAL